jgi:hypothetical protein
MERKAHSFAALDDYQDMYRFIQENPEIIGRETNEYLLLHCSDFCKKGKYTLSRRYLKMSQVVQYSLDLGPDGVRLFFAR